MGEVRRIHAHEEPEFLRLLCTVFNLDRVRASTIFFKEPLHDFRENWAYVESGKILSILTLTPLHFGWGVTYGISGVATAESDRGRGLAGKVIAAAMDRPAASFMLFAHQTDLYDTLGFVEVDRVVHAPMNRTEVPADCPVLPTSEVIALYDAWAEQDPSHLRREAARWEFWRWSMRTTESYGGGYFAVEHNSMREALLPERPAMLPLHEPTQWTGLASLTERLQIPVSDPVLDMIVMGRNLPGQPQMFMTDQF